MLNTALKFALDTVGSQLDHHFWHQLMPRIQAIVFKELKGNFQKCCEEWGLPNARIFRKVVPAPGLLRASCPPPLTGPPPFGRRSNLFQTNLSNPRVRISVLNS